MPKTRTQLKIQRMFVFAYTLTLALNVAGRIECGNVIFILVRGYDPIAMGKKKGKKF